jgi:hypothetical protein
MCNISSKRVRRSLVRTSSAEGMTAWCSAGLRRPRFSFFLFNFQRTDTADSSIRLFPPSLRRLALQPCEECTLVRFLRSFESERCCRQRRAALVVALYSPSSSEVSTRIFEFLELFLTRRPNTASAAMKPYLREIVILVCRPGIMPRASMHWTPGHMGH